MTFSSESRVKDLHISTGLELGVLVHPDVEKAVAATLHGAQTRGRGVKHPARMA